MIRTGERVGICLLGVALLAMTSCDRFTKRTEPCQPKQGAVEVVCSKAIITERLKSGKPIIIKCFAHWCPPCQMMSPIFEAVAKKFADKALFIAIDADNSDTRDALNRLVPGGVKYLPSFIFRNKKGSVVSVNTGSMSEAELIRLIAKVI